MGEFSCDNGGMGNLRREICWDGIEFPVTIIYIPSIDNVTKNIRGKRGNPNTRGRRIAKEEEEGAT